MAGARCHRADDSAERAAAIEVCYEASTGYGRFYELLTTVATQVAVAHPGLLRLIYRSKKRTIEPTRSNCVGMRCSKPQPPSVDVAIDHTLGAGTCWPGATPSLAWACVTPTPYRLWWMSPLTITRCRTCWRSSIVKNVAIMPPQTRVWHPSTRAIAVRCFRYG